MFEPERATLLINKNDKKKPYKPYKPKPSSIFKGLAHTTPR
jgi:hypothetical protein